MGRAGYRGGRRPPKRASGEGSSLEDLRPLAARVAAACRAGDLLAPGDRVLVAVSAGADSTALALLLAALGAHGLPLTLVLAHLDHGWRGAAEAAADLVVVQRLAERIGAPLVIVPAPDPAVPTEDAARRWRYRRLEALAREHGCRRVATGHHLRDQAETVLMRLERGSGRVGLAGIPARRPLGEHSVEVVRPLLGVDPRGLRAWLAERGVGWREDPTNADLSRDRARARARLLAVEARGGRAARDLAALADRLRARLARDEARLGRALGASLCLHPQVPAVEVARATLAALTPPFLDLALRRLGREIAADRDGPFFTRRHLALVGGLLGTGGALDLPRGLHVDVSPTRVWLRRLDAPGVLPRLVREEHDAASFDLAAFLAAGDDGRAALDAEVLGGQARLRLVEPADVFVPWGAGDARARGVLAWLAKRQVPAWLRRRQVVLAGEGGVAWLPGHRVDRRHAVGPATRRVAVVALAWPPGR